MRLPFRLAALALATALVLTGRPAAAQAPPERGEAVRLVMTHPTLRSAEAVTGTFDGLGRDSLYLTRGAYSRSLLRSVEVARGRTSYFLTGAAIGGGVGGVTGGLLGTSNDFANVRRPGDRSVWLRDALIGTAAGAVVGGLIGSFFRHTQWVRVPLDALTASAPPAPFGVGVRYALSPTR